MALVLGAAALAAGCAATQYSRDASGNPRIERLSEEQAARLAPPTPRLTSDNLLRLTREGQTPGQIIEQLRASGTRLALSPSQSAALESQGVSKQVLDWITTAEERARQTDIIDAQVKRETAEANQRRAQEERARQEALRWRRHDPFFGDPFYPYWGPAWPGYWGWRWNYPPRNGMGMFWRAH